MRGGSPERVQEQYITPDGHRWLHGHLNRGKKSIVVDLKHPRAAEVLQPLVRWADVIANNFRAGGLERLGLSYAQCRSWNRRIIYTSNSGFGPKGEWAQKPSFDGIAQAFSGSMVEAGGGPTKGTPVLTPWVFSDEVGALNYTVAILQALYAREKTGLGQRVETSQLGATVAFQYYGLAAALHDPEHKQRDDGKSPNETTIVRLVAKCADDKWLVVLPNTTKQWQSFAVQALERPDFFERAPTKELRNATAEEMKPEIKAELATRSRDEWIQRLNAADVPASPVHDYADVAIDEQLRANGYIKEQEIFSPDDGRSFGTRAIIGYPTSYSETPVPPLPGQAPALAEHTTEVLSGLGFSEDNIAELVSEGVVDGSATRPRHKVGNHSNL